MAFFDLALLLFGQLPRYRPQFLVYKVEHRLLSFITTNWRGEPLRDYETIVQLIAKTTTAKGLKVTCRLDRRHYPVGRKVTDEEFATVRLHPNPFHGEWNYAIRPHANL